MEINLDGTEIMVVKAIGLGGTAIGGGTLLERVRDLGPAELIDTLHGLMALGYVSSSRGRLRTVDDLERADISVNSGYLRELKEALDPRLKKRERPRRTRRE